MKIIKVLKELEKLLNGWGIEDDNWILAAQYAERLLGYDVRTRKGHLNVLIKKSKIPWDVKEEYETHPPIGTKYSQQTRVFMKRTGFEFDIVPVPDEDYKRKVKNTVRYNLSGTNPLVQTPWGGLEELDFILSKCSKKGWGEEKGFRVYPHLEDIIRTGKERRELELVRAYMDLQKRYSRFKIKKVDNRDRGAKIIKGTVASRGMARGIVNIVLNPKLTKRFRKGEILVTTMTSPKFTPFFSKASAIITDEGGMLSHAAIVAREMGIPCIVGTKIATRVLKDGQIVIVYGSKGIVEVIGK